MESGVQVHCGTNGRKEQLARLGRSGVVGRRGVWSDTPLSRTSCTAREVCQSSGLVSNSMYSSPFRLLDVVVEVDRQTDEHHLGFQVVVCVIVDRNTSNRNWKDGYLTRPEVDEAFAVYHFILRMYLRVRQIRHQRITCHLCILYTVCSIHQ